MIRRAYYTAAAEAKVVGDQDTHPSMTTAPDGGPVSPIPGSSGHSMHHHPSRSVRNKHMEHCFDYLRQALACGADSTLEKRDPSISGTRGWGTTHQCRDYQALSKWAEERRYSDSEGT
jgi:hypothetical protein